MSTQTEFPEQILISFDIDGTLSCGDPPGPICSDILQRLVNLGVVVGSCSQNDIFEQEDAWRVIDVHPLFLVSKEYLGILKTYYPETERHIHIGDWLGLDDVVATMAGFEFIHASQAVDALTGLLEAMGNISEEEDLHE